MAIAEAPRETRENVIYPDSDGKPIADNTLQFQWIVTIQGGFAALFATYLEQCHARALAEQRASIAEAQADAERLRAQKAQQQADSERLRAERLAERLRAAGIDPDA